MIRIAICDDDKHMLGVLEKYITNGFRVHTDEFVVKCYDNGNLLLSDNSFNAFDVLFLDIDMPKVSGFDIAHKLRSDFSRCFIIFVTSYSNLVYDSFDYQPFQFIQKNPLKYLEKNFCSVIDKLMNHMKQNKKITLENDRETVNIYYHNIAYIETEKHYLNYYIQNREEPISIRGTINELEKTLEIYSFIRIHRRFIVNLRYIKYIDTKIGKVCLNLNGKNKSLSLGQSYKTHVNEVYSRYLRDTL